MLFKCSVSEVLALSKKRQYIDSDCKGNVEEESAWVFNWKWYIVEFPQDESIESFDAGFVAQVYIWEDTSRPFSIALGNSLIMDLK